MAKNNRVVDQSTMHCYRIELPILIDDLDLSPHEFRLYVRFKRRAGDGGSCYEGTRALAVACGMSVGQVSKAKKSLEDKGLIHIGTKQTRGGQADDITICDLWPRNFKVYAKDESVHQVNALPESVHLVNTSEVLLNRVSVHENEGKCSPGERKKIQHEESPTTTAQHQNGTSVVVGADSFYLELRQRGVGAKKAREIAARPCDQAHILNLIDHRPEGGNLGGLINDILDGVADRPPAPPPANDVLPPPAPRAVLTTADRQALAKQHNPFVKASDE